MIVDLDGDVDGHGDVLGIFWAVPSTSPSPFTTTTTSTTTSTRRDPAGC